MKESVETRIDTIMGKVEKKIEEAYKKGFKDGRDAAWAEVKTIMETGKRPE